jgi:hypothetical protein
MVPLDEVTTIFPPGYYYDQATIYSLYASTSNNLCAHYCQIPSI